MKFVNKGMLQNTMNIQKQLPEKVRQLFLS